MLSPGTTLNIERLINIDFAPLTINNVRVGADGALRSFEYNGVGDPADITIPRSVLTVEAGDVITNLPGITDNDIRQHLGLETATEAESKYLNFNDNLSGDEREMERARARGIIGAVDQNSFNTLNQQVERQPEIFLHTDLLPIANSPNGTLRVPVLENGLDPAINPFAGVLGATPQLLAAAGEIAVGISETTTPLGLVHGIQFMLPNDPAIAAIDPNHAENQVGTGNRTLRLTRVDGRIRRTTLLVINTVTPVGADRLFITATIPSPTEAQLLITLIERNHTSANMGFIGAAPVANLPGGETRNFNYYRRIALQSRIDTGGTEVDVDRGSIEDADSFLNLAVDGLAQRPFLVNTPEGYIESAESFRFTDLSDTPSEQETIDQATNRPTGSDTSFLTLVSDNLGGHSFDYQDRQEFSQSLRLNPDQLPALGTAPMDINGNAVTPRYVEGRFLVARDDADGRPSFDYEAIEGDVRVWTPAIGLTDVAVGQAIKRTADFSIDASVAGDDATVFADGRGQTALFIRQDTSTNREDLLPIAETNHTANDQPRPGESYNVPNVESLQITAALQLRITFTDFTNGRSVKFAHPNAFYTVTFLEAIIGAPAARRTYSFNGSSVIEDQLSRTWTVPINGILNIAPPTAAVSTGAISALNLESDGFDVWLPSGETVTVQNTAKAIVEVIQQRRELESVAGTVVTTAAFPDLVRSIVGADDVSNIDDVPTSLYTPHISIPGQNFNFVTDPSQLAQFQTGPTQMVLYNGPAFGYDYGAAFIARNQPAAYLGDVRRFNTTTASTDPLNGLFEFSVQAVTGVPADSANRIGIEIGSALFQQGSILRIAGSDIRFLGREFQVMANVTTEAPTRSAFLIVRHLSGDTSNILQNYGTGAQILIARDVVRPGLIFWDPNAANPQDLINGTFTPTGETIPQNELTGAHNVQDVPGRWRNAGV